MVSKDDLANAVLMGISEANEFYHEISHGHWVSDSGVENIIQYKVAETLRRFFVNSGRSDYSIFLEYPIYDFVYESGGIGAGRWPEIIYGPKRLDIAIFDDQDKPIVPIEIKRSVSGDYLVRDVERVAAILKKCTSRGRGSLEFGIVCGFGFGRGSHENAAADDLRRRINAARERVEAVIGYRFSSGEPTWHSRVGNAEEYVDDGRGRFWISGAVCAVIPRHPRNVADSPGQTS
jgi:hypothetical protein